MSNENRDFGNKALAKLKNEAQTVWKAISLFLVPMWQRLRGYPWPEIGLIIAILAVISSEAIYPRWWISIKPAKRRFVTATMSWLKH